MGDGRLDASRLQQIARRFARRVLIADFAGLARRSASPLGAVLLGALAASGAVPIEAEAFRAAIRGEGKAVDANLSGFEAGLAAAQGAGPASALAEQGGSSLPPEVACGLEHIPAEAHAVVCEGARRLLEYQDQAYARLYVERVRARALLPHADGPFVRELARHLVLRMSVEDVIRVAQLKLRGARHTRVRNEAQARSGDIVDISEYMNPGVEEILGLLPPRLGRWALGHVRGSFSWPLCIRTTRFAGFLRLALVAALRRWRPRTLRFAEENAWVDRWLDLVERALLVCPSAAREVVATAGLVRGYSDTYQRGMASWNLIAEGVVEPMLSGQLAGVPFADAVLQARIAALKDPEGVALKETIAAIARTGAAGGNAGAAGVAGAHQATAPRAAPTTERSL